jgi:hypothetical protein
MNQATTARLAKVNDWQVVAEDCPQDATEDNFEIFNSIRDFGYLVPGITSAASVATCLCCEGIDDVMYTDGRVYINDEHREQAYDILEDYIGFEMPEDIAEDKI